MELRYRMWLSTLSAEERCEVERLAEMTFRTLVVRALVVVAIMCAIIAITVKTLP